ncbi:MAG: hypothetical protein ACTHXA_08600 [Gulosibacter sp.]|uniref:hypothetical protein n=1 Tax=Gulosibacter sp. TaxID=2817531 RepID=UPI003F92A1EE
MSAPSKPRRYNVSPEPRLGNPAPKEHAALMAALIENTAPCDGDQRFTDERTSAEELRPICGARARGTLCRNYASAARPIAGVWAGHRYGSEGVPLLGPKSSREPGTKASPNRSPSDEQSGSSPTEPSADQAFLEPTPKPLTETITNGAKSPRDLTN